MAVKLPYRVAHLSGHEDNFTGKELEQGQTPTTKGWLSSRFCIYPQEIVLSLPSLCRIRVIQVLSHEHLIASKIELFVGCGLPSQPQSLVNAKFKRLGYFCLKDNSSTDYNSRELKSVHIDVECCLVKLLVHKNHVNSLNLYNQVSVVAINILGHRLDGTEQQPEISGNNITNAVIPDGDELNADPLLLGRINRPDYISPLYDLAFDMCQDPETAQLIRKLDRKKATAVIEERYDYAKKLKMAITDLKEVGEKLGKWEVEKRKAVELENFDLAKIKKLQSDEYRLFVYKQLDLFDLLEISKDDPTKVSPRGAEQRDGKQRQHQKPGRHGNGQLSPIVLSPRRHEDAVATDFTPGNSPRDAPESTQRHSPYETQVNDADERCLPALEIKETEPHDSPRPLPDILETPRDIETYAVPDSVNSLTEQEEEEAMPIIESFGMFLAKCVYSKVWQHRHSAANIAIADLVSEADDATLSSVEPKRVVKGTVAFVLRLLKDHVFCIFTQSITMTKTLFTSYSSKSKLSKGDLTFALEKLVPAFFQRTGDSSIRIRDAVVGLICELAIIKEVKASRVITELLTSQFAGKGQIPWRTFQCRLEMIEKLLDPLLPGSTSGFQTLELMKMLLKALEQSSREVRDCSVRCIMMTYKLIGKVVKKFLPPDDHTTRKNPLYSKIFDGFDRIDGIPTLGERKELERQIKIDSEKAKKKALASLQGQLHALRSIAAAESSEQGSLSSSQTTPRADISRKEKGDSVAVNSQFIDRVCMFCGDHNDDYKNEDALDVHYWRSCPLLKRCNHCNQVIEISNIHNHLLIECEKQGIFVKCSHCSESVVTADYDAHHMSETCKAVANTKPNCCPLCRKRVLEGDTAWKSHLTVECKINAKRLQQLQILGSVSTPSQGKELAQAQKNTPKGTTASQRRQVRAMSRISTKQ